MVRFRKAWVPLLVALGVTLGAFGLLLPDTGSVAAQATPSPSATRSLSSTSVNPGAEVVVTIDVNYGGITGQFDKFAINVRETLPVGFSYVSSSLDIVTEIDARTVNFTPTGSESFDYTVTASDVPGDDYRFQGVLVEDAEQGIEHSISDSIIQVVATAADTPTPTATPATVEGPSARRVLPSAPVGAGDQVEVTINIDYADLGQVDRLRVGVAETLPPGFTYVSSSLDEELVFQQNGVVQFGAFSETSFTYTVTAASLAGPHTFRGELTGLDSPATIRVGGDSTVTVDAPRPPSATRSFSDMYVDEGGQVVVTINIDYSDLGQVDRLRIGVAETLPLGFTYVSSSLDEALVFQQNGVVQFGAFSETSFTYTVTAASTLDDYMFSGELIGTGLDPAPSVGGSSTLTVGPEPTPTPTPVPPTATPTPTTVPDGTPRPATRTPRPTAVPAAPATPVAIEIVSDVTMAEGATVVQPDASSVVSSSDGMATVMLPNTSRARTYQVMVSSDAAGCSGGDLAGAMKACVTITSYDAEGNMESGVMLIRRATVVMMLDAAAVEELGGLPVVFQANALGAFSVYQRDDADDSWGMRRSTMGLTDDGGIAVTVTSLRSLGSLALAVDEDILQTAMYQVAGITPTPVPAPVVATATPVPTAVPTPEPTATPPADEKPPVGDTTLPVGLLVVLGLTGALMVYTGSRVMRTRRSATRS